MNADFGTAVVIMLAFAIGYVVVSFIFGQSKPIESAREQRESKDDQKDESRQDRESGNDKNDRNKQNAGNYSSSSGTYSRIKDEKYYGNVLGLRGKVSLDDVRQQYRHLAMQYHPDKVNHLGPKLRKLAEMEMKELNEAFHYFTDRYR